jgi:6-phosphogluconolactonase
VTRVTLRAGTYAKASGRGLYRLEYDGEHGFTLGPPLTEAANASFGAFSPVHGILYLVNEQPAGALGMFRHAGGAWAPLARIPTGGREPCFVAVDPAGSHVAVANYASGSVALFRLDAQGVPQEDAALWANAGHGPNPERQDAPHLHCVRFSPDGKWLYAVDLGTDQVLRFAMDMADPLATAEIAYRAPPGAGPRHLLFTPGGDRALLVSELASTLAVLRVTEAGLALEASLSTLPDGFSGESLGGHLEMNRAGNRVYVTNRGHDSIAIFDFDARSGALTPLQWIASGGASPRFLLLLEDRQRLIVAHEEGGTLVAFTIRPDGTFAPTGQTQALPAPVFLFREN